MGFCLDLPGNSCSGDAECAGDELCWLTFFRACAPGDSRCEEPSYATCEDWGRMCGPGSRVSCEPYESCVAGRCVRADFAGEAAAIVIDEQKEMRLRPIWERGPEAVDGDGGGCSAGRQSPAAWWAFPLLLALWHLRRRASRPR